LAAIDCVNLNDVVAGGSEARSYRANPRANSLTLNSQLLIFAVALLLRAGYVLAQYRWGIVSGDFKSGDAGLYLRLADSLLAGRGLADGSGPTAFVMPGYPLFLSACFYLFGRNSEIASLIQSGLSALACVWIARSTALLFSRSAGVVAGLIAAGYYELVLWTSGQLLTEPLYFFLVASAIYALLAALDSTPDSSRRAMMALAGALFGLAALVRPNALGVVAVIALMMAGIAVWNRQSRDTLNAALFVAGCVVVMLPWGIRNSVAVGQFTLASTEGGHVFWLGNNPGYDRRESPDFIRYGGYTAMFPGLAEAAGKSEIEANRIYRQAAINHIIAHPGLWVERGFHKLWNMWRPTFSHSSWRNRLLAWTLYPALLGLSVCGLIAAWPERARAWPLFVFLLGNLLIHFTITGEIRFRVPLWVALIPFAAVSITRMIPSNGEAALA